MVQRTEQAGNIRAENETMSKDFREKLLKYGIFARFSQRIKAISAYSRVVIIF
jgi:hypothetical protein